MLASDLCVPHWHFTQYTNRGNFLIRQVSRNTVFLHNLVGSVRHHLPTLAQARTGLRIGHWQSINVMGVDLLGMVG